MTRLLAIVLLLLVVVGGVGYLVLRHQQRAALTTLQQASQEEMEAVQSDALVATHELAEDLARVLSAATAGSLARSDYGSLQSEVDAMVRGHRVVRVIVLDADARVVATTDRRYVGQGREDEGNRRAAGVEDVTVVPADLAPGEIEVDAPVSLGSQRVGSVRVVVDVALDTQRGGGAGGSPLS